MPIDPVKLKSYLAARETRPGRRPASVPAEAPANPAQPEAGAMKAALIYGADTDDAAVARLASKKVGYMELFGKVRGFACGSCRSYDAGEGVCGNPAVNAPVSDDHGCCNLWWGADETEITFPPAK